MMNDSGASAAAPSSGSPDGAAARTSKRPKYSRFTQQELPACKPILTPQWVISVFALVGIIFIPIGVAALLASNDVVEIVDQYETACVPPSMTNNKIGYIQNSNFNKTCTRVLKRAQRKALDILNTVGLSNSVLKLIERRHRVDKWVAYAGMMITVLVMYMFWRWTH